MSVQLPRLLDEDMRETCRLHPLKLSLTRAMLPLSTAVMTLPPGECAVDAGSMIELFDLHGSAGVYRVTETSLDCATGVQLLHLEHGLCTLGDYVLMGEHVYENLTGGSGDSGLAEAMPIAGVITAPPNTLVWLRSGRVNVGMTIKTMAPGTEVTVIDAQGDWFRVICGSDTGWVQRVYVELVEDEVAANDTLRTVLADLLQKQTGRVYWQLGDVEVYVRNGYIFRNQNLLDAILSTASSVMEDCMWDFDQRTLPWTLHLRRLPDTTGCEMRMRRSIAGMTVTIDRSDLCTCLYPVGASGLTVETVNNGSPCLLSDQAQVWGRIERVYLDGSESNPVTLLCAARKALKALEKPQVSVEISGLDLSAETGEPLDRLTLGSRCRVPLPDRQTTVQERIVTLDWPDLIHAPQQVRVTMASTRANAASLLAAAHSTKRLI